VYFAPPSWVRTGQFIGTVYAEELPGVIEISRARCEDSMYVASMRTHVQRSIIKLPAMGDKRKVDAPPCPYREFPYSSKKETANGHQPEESLIRSRDCHEK
jgi:hypothetical protein